jgi:hypothetical protein
MAVGVSQRMSSDAMAVVIGVAAGIAASIPTSVLIVAILRSDSRTAQPEAFQPPQQQMLVLNPADLFK